jgi:hypothetical protein
MGAERGEFLFLGGVARSGTTALAHMLGGHGGIALGMERFKDLWQPSRLAEFGPELFVRERFFDFDDGLTNVTPARHARWARYYERVAAKYDTAVYRGDKMTRPWFDETWARFPRARFVCIIRNVFDVAHSWQERAANPEDTSWAATNDARAAVGHWNRTLQLIADAHRRRPDHVLVVDYDTIFSEDGPLRAVLDTLGLAWEPAIGRAYESARSRNEQLIDKARVLAVPLHDTLEQHADWATWEAVRSLAVDR